MSFNSSFSFIIINKPIREIWWNINKQPFGLSYEKALILYACVQLVNGVVLLAFGVFLPLVITRVIELISNALNIILYKNSIEGSTLPGIYILFCYGSVIFFLI